jgi:hypothetical protein
VYVPDVWSVVEGRTTIPAGPDGIEKARVLAMDGSKPMMLKAMPKTSTIVKLRRSCNISINRIETTRNRRRFAPPACIQAVLNECQQSVTQRNSFETGVTKHRSIIFVRQASINRRLRRPPLLLIADRCRIRHLHEILSSCYPIFEK